MKVYRDLVENGVLVSKEIFDIAECTYTGKDMGERSITATIYFATPIDFQIGDYIKLPMQNLIRSTSGVNGSIASGSGEVEKFYIYTMPTMKKVARAMENGKAFEHTVTFYPAQYELSCVQMRDLGNSLSADEIIYTGFDSVSFNGGAKELMDRIMMVLKEAYHDSEGNPLWSYEISDSVNEEKNLALERFPISFSGNTVMDALLELNNKETINTTFFINNRKIYVGFKRPYFCRVTDGMSIDTNPSSQLFTFQYGKTSDKGVALQYGGLYDITKSVGKEVPITKLFAYGASRNLNRYYCSDRVKGGRYVNRLMLPSFDTDGKTDFIISEDALQRYGVREGTKQFEEIYPSIRYATYGDIRQVKYCIKVKASGVKDENIDSPSYSVARIQCYKIVEGEITGVNKLVEAAPPDDLAIYIHAMDKVVKVVLYGGATDAEAISKQRQHDTKVPTYTSGGSDYIPGACFIVHDRGFDEAGTVYENANRSAWFTSIDNLSGFTEKQKEEIKLNQINYTDTFWLTDLYIFHEYNQTYFSRDGYSAWSWARLNSKYTSLQGSIASDSVIVNEIVHVEPITLADTSMTAAGIDKPQSTFDIYLRDLGFTINEQNDFGEMVFILNGTVKVSILDGLLAGQEFEISGSINSTSPSCICAFNDDGTRNEAFFAEPDYTQDGANPQTPYDAFNKGAIWRVRLNRTNVDDPDYSNLNLAMPTKEINAKSGDHLVLLDLFMPDIYIHAAENRLLREARKYLEANDNGSISYAVNFDKVRMQQIPNYAMQLREGLNLRVVDEDLNIKTENNGRYIADYRDNKLYSQRTLDNGKNIDWISANAPIDFTRSKYYIVEFSIFNSSAFDINAFNFALFKSKNEESISFVPEFTVEQEVKGMEIILKVKFQLPDNFDDGQLYYPSAYLCKLKSWYNIVDMYLISVFERDYAENEEVLNYADFTIDSLTVKITDNSGNNEPIREITATLSEQTNATAWATLMNRVATTAKEGAQNKKALEEVVNTARRNYQALLSLKDSIFDPDGSCDQVFLQVMMQQVGADSMNYQLDNTRSGLGSDGQPTLFNCSCERGSDGYYHFKVYSDDTLRHYVYTQGSQAGNWEIPVGATGVDVQLNGTDSYFVCLKCPKNDTVGQWICSTKQYAVNDPEDDGCWFFNWAILTVDSGGVYTLMETRGNAYMYGDNLVCGKISTMAGNSYFDLTHGNFVLGDGTGPALSYIDGVLTISGSKGDAEETLIKLGLLQKDVETAQSTADAAAQAAKDEAEKVREEYKVAIAESEDDMNKALAASVATINGGLEALQKQVDGEVSSYFYPYSPIGNDESVRMDVEPMSEWLQNYSLTNGVYVLKDGAINELINNIGDTFTNTEVFESEDLTPLAGKSWRWCDATNTPSIEKYIVVQYGKDGITKTMKLHWHIITDTDAIRALEAAKNAQATADGKTTTFVGNEDPTNYGIGDLWILPNDKTLNGTTYKKGTILTANKESETFDASHWSEDVKYTDDTIAYQAKNDAADAKKAADSAQKVADDAAERLEDWADDGVISPIEKQGIKDEKTRISADKEQITSSCNQYGISIASYETAYNNYASELDSIINSTTETVPIPNGFKSSQTTYYARRTSVLNAISQQAQTVAEAYARQQAQQALDGLELGGENLVLESKGDSNKNIRANNTSTSAEFQYSCTPINDGTYGDELKIGLTCSTQGKYAPDSYSYTTCIWVQCKKETIKGKKYTISFDARLLPSSSADNCTVYFRAAGTGYSTTQMGKAVIDKTKKRYSITVDSNAESDTNTYSYFTLFLSRTTTIYISNVKVEQGNKDTGWSPAPEDVDSKANAIKAIADEANEKAIESNAQLANMSDDSILTPQEKGSVADEWACIQKEYTQNESNKESVWGNATVTEWTAYNTAYTTLQTYVGTLALTDRANNTKIDKSTFQTNFANYYSANVAFLNALSKKVAELEVAAMEIGGRNLLRNSAIVTHTAGATNNYSYKVLTPTVGLQPNTNYVFSVDKSEMTAGSDTAFTVYIIDSSITNRRNGFTIPISNERQSVSFKTMPSVTDTDVVLVYAGKQGTTAGKAIKLTNIKLEQGTKATDWTPAPEDVDAAIAAVYSKAQALEYLKTALTDGSTEIAGGLTMTNVLMLKNLEGFVTAGLSGLTKHNNKEDKVLLWGGATYEEAYAAANNDNYDTGIGTITTLLKKDGTGKIGIFKISDTKAVVDVPNQGKVIIDASDANGGIFIHDKDDAQRIIISPKTISDSKYAPPSIVNWTARQTTSNTTNATAAYYIPSEYKDIPLTPTKLINEEGSIKKFDINLYFSGIKCYVQSNPTQILNDFSLVFCVKLMSTDNILYYTSTPITVTNTQYSQKTVSIPSIDVPSGTYKVVLSVAHSSNYTNAPHVCSFDVQYNWSANFHPAYNSKTIICQDGFISAYDATKYFMVQNTSEGQKIYAKGLSQAKGTQGSGELYVTSDFIEAFKSFVTKAKELFAAARYVGSNEDYRSDANTECDKILEELETTSIIANS